MNLHLLASGCTLVPFMDMMHLSFDSKHPQMFFKNFIRPIRVFGGVSGPQSIIGMTWIQWLHLYYRNVDSRGSSAVPSKKREKDKRVRKICEEQFWEEVLGWLGFWLGCQMLKMEKGNGLLKCLNHFQPPHMGSFFKTRVFLDFFSRTLSFAGTSDRLHEKPGGLKLWKFELVGMQISTYLGLGGSAGKLSNIGKHTRTRRPLLPSWFHLNFTKQPTR